MTAPLELRFLLGHHHRHRRTVSTRKTKNCRPYKNVRGTAYANKSSATVIAIRKNKRKR